MNMPEIKSYSFGRMQIDQKTYTNDLIIFPTGHIQDSWWRKDGHRLSVKDIEPVLSKKPDLIITGTGSNDRMIPAPEMKTFLSGRGIEFFALPTARAADLYNEKKDAGIRVCACFHLTC